MAYSSWSVIYGEQPSATKWNILGSNDASFNDGTGIGTGAIGLSKLDATVLFPGLITPYGGAGAPTGWFLCDGSAKSRSTYSALFAVLGTLYGAGDGLTTFNIPNLQGRLPIGKNGGTFSALGLTGGAESHTLTAAQMPVHNHGVSDPGHAHTYTQTSQRLTKIQNPSDNTEGVGDIYTATSTSVNGTGISINNAGSGASHPILNPYQVVNYLIKY